jgi:hypothetical protein
MDFIFKLDTITILQIQKFYNIIKETQRSIDVIINKYYESI